MWNKVFTIFLLPTLLFGEIKAVIFSFGAETSANWNGVGAWAMHFIDLSKEKADDLIRQKKAFVANGGSEEVFWESYKNSFDAKFHPMWLPLALPAEYHIDPMWASPFQRAFFESMQNIPEMINIIAALQNAGYRTPLICRQKLNHYLLLSDGLYGRILPLHAIERYEELLPLLKLSIEEVVFVDVSETCVETFKSNGGDGIVFKNPEQIVEELASRGVPL